MIIIKLRVAYSVTYPELLSGTESGTEQNQHRFDPEAMPF